MEKLLEIKNLNLYFGQYQALYNVNLSLDKGSFYSLVGESGCGKTITAMSVLRLLPKSAVIKNGEIIFNGETHIYG
jgi:ABC-type dipeptide/oligopeptide/nickel transport system ATPase component